MFKFENGEKYRVLIAWESDTDLRNRLQGQCYKLVPDDIVVFRGPNLGHAEFKTASGKLVILRPKIAFKILVPFSLRLNKD